MFKGLMLLTLLSALVVKSAPAQEGEFCKGFAEGFKTVKGGIVPICPIAPITPIGSTPFREGIKAGITAGQRLGGGNSGGPSSPGSSGTFCDGFNEGWKTVKGSLRLVPICPIPPITPIGSTPFREGLKAGIAKANST